MAEYSRIETLLGGLHYLDSDVRIEFGETGANHAHVHSSVLAAECSRLDLDTPFTLNSDSVRVFAVVFAHGTCALSPLTSGSVLSSDVACHRFHDSSLAPAGWSTPRHDDDYRGQAARNQNLYAKRQYIAILNILYGEPVTLDDLEPYPSRDVPLARLHSATTSVIETCARAEALGCLGRVARVLLALVFESNLLGQCVAQTPIKFLKLATKGKSTKLFFMASRHICADRKLARNWFDASVYYNVNHDGVALQLAPLMGHESRTAQKLQQALLDVQLCRTHMMAASTTHSSYAPTFPLSNAVVKQSYCGECIARTYFAEWLSETLDHCAAGQQTDTCSSEGTLGAALNHLQRFATTLMPFQVFSASSNTHKTLAHELGLCGDVVVERAIKFHLDQCVYEAATAINTAFRSSPTELTEQNFPSLRKVSAETATTSTGQSEFSHRPSRASTSVGELNPAAVSFTCNDGVRAARETERAGRVDSLSPRLSAASPPLQDLFPQKPSWLQIYLKRQGNGEHMEEGGEACLPSDLLAEMDDPRDERWTTGTPKHHLCCGRKREMGNAHQCGSAKVVAVKWPSELRVAGQGRSIW